MSPAVPVSSHIPLNEEEIQLAARLVRETLPGPRFSHITLSSKSPRAASVTALTSDGIAHELEISLGSQEVKHRRFPKGTQPVLTPDDCTLAEDIVKNNSELIALLNQRFDAGVDDVVADPWSLHVAGKYDFLESSEFSPRLVQTFLYWRASENDNHYAHPLDILPVVDLNSKTLVSIEGSTRLSHPISKTSVNYRADLLQTNEYLQRRPRSGMKRLQVVQPDGPSFEVHHNDVEWQEWSFTVGFNYREGLVLHDVSYGGRSVVKRASLVEMAVPYADPHPPFERKCAFDVGDYGLGYCTNSLELGCDCLGSIHYFDAVLANSKGEPYTIKNAVCMHEEDAGLLYKHVEYRTGHSETRRARRLVVSFIATVVNYEYLFYWYFHHDGSFSLEIKLSGELSTNMLSAGETHPTHGVLVAPGVNAQIHQHMFCARLEMAVDGARNSIEEVNLVPATAGKDNPYGNAFNVTTTQLKRELEAQREAAAGRTWRVYNPHKKNEISGKTIGYKLVPYTFGSFQPLLLTATDSAVSKRGRFATKSLWVTPFAEGEKFPAGDYPTQSTGGDGLEKWTMQDRSIVNEELVVWHCFGVAHVPRTEDFPVMPCESTGFTVKPDCFFLGNPGIDLPDTKESSSVCCS